MYTHAVLQQVAAGGLAGFIAHYKGIAGAVGILDIHLGGATPERPNWARSSCSPRFLLASMETAMFTAAVTWEISTS